MLPRYHPKKKLFSIVQKKKTLKLTLLKQLALQFNIKVQVETTN